MLIFFHQIHSVLAHYYQVPQISFRGESVGFHTHARAHRHTHDIIEHPHTRTHTRARAHISTSARQLSLVCSSCFFVFGHDTHFQKPCGQIRGHVKDTRGYGRGSSISLPRVLLLLPALATGVLTAVEICVFRSWRLREVQSVPAVWARARAQLHGKMSSNWSNDISTRAIITLPAIRTR